MIECMEQRLNEAAKNPVYQYGMLAGVTLLAAALRFLHHLGLGIYSGSAHCNHR
jgi:hypothetical protein